MRGPVASLEIRFDSQYTNPMLGFSDSLPWIRSVTNFNIVNNWTKTMGTQIIKWGVDIRRERQDLLQTQSFNPRGRFVFTAGTTSLNGGTDQNQLRQCFRLVPARPAGRGSGRDLAVIFPARRNTIYNLYFQDKWQISQKLTVDLGLRWEYWPSSTPHHPGGFSNYNPFNNTLWNSRVSAAYPMTWVLATLQQFRPANRCSRTALMKRQFFALAMVSATYLETPTFIISRCRKPLSFLPPINSFVAVGIDGDGFPGALALPYFLQLASS